MAKCKARLENHGELVVDILIDGYNDLKRAKAIQILALAVEQKFDLVIENHADLERSLLELALRWSIYGYRESAEVGQLINRRIANSLTMSRVYVDHTGHELAQVYGRDGRIREKFSFG